MYWLKRGMNVDLGFLPEMLDDKNPATATQQLDTGYKHGGGWSPFPGHTMDKQHRLYYPGDPPLAPIAMTKLRDELILLYDCSWVAVVQPDGTFEVCRMD